MILEDETVKAALGSERHRHADELQALEARCETLDAEYHNREATRQRELACDSAVFRGELRLAEQSIRLLEGTLERAEREHKQARLELKLLSTRETDAVEQRREAMQAEVVRKAVLEAVALSEARAALATREAVRKALQQREADQRPTHPLSSDDFGNKESLSTAPSCLPRTQPSSELEPASFAFDGRDREQGN